MIQNIDASIGQVTANISWLRPNNTEGKIIRYEVFISTELIDIVHSMKIEVRTYVHIRINSNYSVIVGITCTMNKTLPNSNPVHSPNSNPAHSPDSNPVHTQSQF